MIEPWERYSFSEAISLQKQYIKIKTPIFTIAESLYNIKTTLTNFKSITFCHYFNQLNHLNFERNFLKCTAVTRLIPADEMDRKYFII